LCFGWRSLSGVCPAVDAELRGSAEVLTEVAGRVATAETVLTGVAELGVPAVEALDVTRVGELDVAGESVAAGVEAAAEPDGPPAAVGDAVVGLVADGVGASAEPDEPVVAVVAEVEAGRACSQAVQDGSGADQVLLQAGWVGLAGSVADC
jgi:hypothetical protein